MKMGIKNNGTRYFFKIIHFKWISCKIYELYFKKVIF